MFECFNAVYTIYHDKHAKGDVIQHVLTYFDPEKSELEVEKINENPFKLYSSYLDMLRKPMTEKTVENDIH